MMGSRGLMGGIAPVSDRDPPSTSLMAGMPFIESGRATARSMALAGRRVMNTFEDVIRLRHIFWQKGLC